MRADKLHSGSQLSPAPDYPRALDYPACRAGIRNGDLLLWRPTSLIGRLIALGTRSRYSHAAMAGWEGDASEPTSVLKAHEFLQWHGGRSVNLSVQVRRWPGRCDLFRVPDLHGRIAARAISRRTGQPYGWFAFLRIALRAVLPWLHDGQQKQANFNEPLICSAAVADAVRRGGVYIAPDKAVWEITPADLVAEAQYLGTLWWVEPERE